MAIILMLDPDFPLTPGHDVYWKALGKFIHRFAMLEQQIAYLLQLSAKVPKETAQALFHGTRAKAAIDNLNRLREVRGLAEDPDWKRVVDQFGIINSVRNDIVHYGATLHDDGFKIASKRNIPRKQTVTQVDAPQLDAMTEDLQTIAATVFVQQCIANEGKFEGYATDWREVGRAPWKYKPAQQAT
jgi:hypothetical protein